MRGRWPFVGRSDEFGWALAALDGSPAGGGFVLTGSSGVGKSGLLRQVLDRLDSRRFSVLGVFATAATSSVHLGAFVHLLPPELMGVSDPRQLLAHALGIVRAEAAGRRVVLAVDDVHLLDPLGAALVYYAVRSGQASLAATQRTGEVVPDPISALWREDLTTSITIRPLDEATVHTLLARVLHGPVDGVTALRLWRLSQGNVLQLREIVEALLDQSLFELRQGVWRWAGDITGLVTSTTQMIRRRVEQLADPVRVVVELVALAEPVGLAAVTTLTSDTAVRAALDSQLVQVYRDQLRMVLRVGHPMYGDVIKQRMNDHDRHTHITALTAVLQSYGTRRRDDVMRIGIWHLAHGVPADAAILTNAARLAFAAFDLHLATQLGHAAAVEGGFDAVEVLATAQGFTGEPAAALSLLDAAVPSLTGEGEQIRWSMARAIIEFNMLHDVTAVEHLFMEAARLSSADRDILVALAGCLQAGRGDIADGLATLTGLLHRPSASALVRAYAAAMTSAVTAALGETGAVARFTAMEGPARELYAGWPTLRVTVEFARWMIAFVTGQLPALVPATASEALRFFPIVDTQALMAQAISSRLRGQVRAAADAAASARLLADVGGQLFVAAAIAEVACAAALMGDVAAAKAAMAECDQRYRQTMALQYPLIELARVQVAAAEVDGGGAAALARALAARLRRDKLYGFEVHALHMLARLGEPDAADVERLDELAALIPETFPIAAALHARAVAGGSLDGLAQAAQAFATLDLQVFALEAVAQRYELMRRRRAPGTGQAADEVAALWDKCEALCLPALRLGQPRLTTREQEVAELVATGLGAGEVSATLVIEKRSVESHLARIYRKLGAHGRDDLPGILRLNRALRQ